MTLNERLLAVKKSFEENLQALYCEDVPQKRLFEAVRYSLLAGGKRLRPFFVFEFCRACGKDDVPAIAPALAVEMIHTYSLIHDDLPCMDNDDYRRGRLTNHKVYGEAIACLAGDGLLTDAFSVIAEAEALSCEQKTACISILSRCAGSFGMVGGQVLDIDAENRECTAQEIFDIQSRKTGALIRAACQMGAVCGGAGDEKLAAAGAYADYLGLAFQIQDDILDVEGEAEKLGKAVGTDEHKNTFVKLFGLARCHEMVAEYTEKAKTALKPFGEKAELLCALADELSVRDH